MNLSGLRNRNWLGGSYKNNSSKGHLVVQSVKCPTSLQVMIPRFVSLSPALGSVLTVQSLELALDFVCVSLSAPLLLMICLSVSLSLKSK